MAPETVVGREQRRDGTVIVVVAIDATVTIGMHPAEDSDRLLANGFGPGCSRYDL